MKPQDVKQCFDYFNYGIKSGAYPYTGTNKKIQKKDYKFAEEELKSKKKKRRIQLVCEDLEKKIIVGNAFLSLGFGRIKHVSNFSWFVHPKYHGCGIATKLAQELLKIAKSKKIKKIEATICEKNIGSIKIAEKLGMKLEGRNKKSHRLDNGRYVDILLYGRWIG